MMDVQATGQIMLGRRGLLAWGGRLAGAGAVGAFLPGMAWAQAAEKYPTIKAEFDSYVSSGKLPGVLATIGRASGLPDVIAVGTQGLGEKTPVNIDSLWRVYSMTKPITGMAAMILVGEGKMKLDQPISEFLPEFANMTVLTDPEKSMDAVPAKNQITVRHLLTHTAGLGYSIITKGPLLQAYLDNGITPGIVSRFPIPGQPTSKPTPDLKTFSERLAKLPLIAEPGTKWSYSISLDLLGRVIEVASGMDFEAFLKTRIFEPLKMNSSYFQVPKSETPRLVSNYAPVNGVLFPIDPAATSIYLDKPAFAFGGAGVVCSARDYDRFLNMLANYGELDGVRIMSPKTAALAMSDLLPPAVSTDGTYADGAGFGAGGRVGKGANEGVYGWGGAAGTVAFVDPKRKLRAVCMAQYMPSNAYPFHENFAKWVLKDLGLPA
ncbi:CubicO group peptidase (beta-lactamase class C family) [Sphingorhabdus rigui]|uniref:CubicO group peptidase (Beta-lactamase class C family) n=1 Tax=Sphingorhabdus rigui TaxID=1282858 RepID=A0A840B2E3_9SPHN|nr:serine hydrolase domain-containing protein [Sphingorhabdus rigui]MBB3943357.1 CubicO group peptidase (beta-lactamase class C family) [Sphingorhabdus rigui]